MYIIASFSPPSPRILAPSKCKCTCIYKCTCSSKIVYSRVFIRRCIYALNHYLLNKLMWQVKKGVLSRQLLLRFNWLKLYESNKTIRGEKTKCQLLTPSQVPKGYFFTVISNVFASLSHFLCFSSRFQLTEALTGVST